MIIYRINNKIVKTVDNIMAHNKIFDPKYKFDSFDIVKDKDIPEEVAAGFTVMEEENDIILGDKKTGKKIKVKKEKEEK
jgi:hypothetical protein